MYKLFLATLINLFLLQNISFAADKVAVEERLSAMDKSFFIASGAQERVLKIGLLDCIAYALKSNSEIKIERITPKLKADDVSVAWADFEPAFTTDFTVNDTTVVASSTLQGATKYNTQDMQLNAGISGKLVTGTEYTLDFLNSRYKSDSTYQIYNPYYTAEPEITITQPLFKGFGILVNKADILIARNETLQSEKSFKDTVITVISKVKNTYYKYVFFLEAYTIETLALERTRDLLKIDKERYAKGLASSVDVLETEAALAQKQRVLLAAEAEVKKAEDELKLVTNLVDDPETWNAKVELLDKPEFKKEEVDLVKSIKVAFENRPDYQAAKIGLKSKDIKIKVAENDLLPTLDLSGSFGLNGLGKDYDVALKKANSDYQDWGAGVKLSIPWGEGDRAKFDQRKLEKTQALLEFKRLEQKIILEVRDKVREVDIQARQVEVAKLYREKEEENYIAQKERYAAGQVSTHDILDYQDKLSRAQLGYLQSLIDHSVALVNLDKSEGITLVKNNVKLEE